MHRALLHEESFLERMLPQRPPPLRELVAAPHVVDENVEAPLLAMNAFRECTHLLGHSVIGLHGNALPSGGRHSLGGFFDRFGTRTRGLAAYAPSGAVDGCAKLAECGSDSTPCATGGARDERDASGQRRHSASFSMMVLLRRRCSVERKTQLESRSTAQRTRDRQSSAEQHRQPARDAESKPRTGMTTRRRLIDLPERLEDPL